MVKTPPLAPDTVPSAPHVLALTSSVHFPGATAFTITTTRVSEMPEDTPTILEITQLTQQELTTAKADDPIRECGRAALALLPSDPETCLMLAYQKLHDVPYKDVKICWRRLYVDASLWKAVKLIEENNIQDAAGKDLGDERENESAKEDKWKWVDELVKLLDMALILTGAPQREEVIELWFSALNHYLTSCQSTWSDIDHNGKASPRQAKRRKISSTNQTSCVPCKFPADAPKLALSGSHSIPKVKTPSLSNFQTRLDNIKTHTPLIIQDSVDHWPALGEHPWSSPSYLLDQTLGGRRLVPVEIGRSYTDEGWQQKIITFKEFMDKYMFPDASTQESDAKRNPDTANRTGYLAQHDLFAQIPSLRADIGIPDYCYTEPAPSPHLTHITAVPKLEEPLLNAWFGPAGTISPLHTDPYHNILVQVVGYKYVRLYAPEETARLYPRGVDENGVDMSNTSQVDLDEGMAVWPSISCWERSSETEEPDDRRRRELEEQYPRFKDARYVEGVLGPGESLYLPVGWWHYVRSLTPSFSVSFWFN